MKKVLLLISGTILIFIALPFTMLGFLYQLTSCSFKSGIGHFNKFSSIIDDI